jgi:hypothetical protein
MAWATAAEGRMHIVGGYGEGQVNRAYHHIYDPRADRWLGGAPLPRGANHVAVCAAGGRVYAFGGFVEQNRRSDTHAYAYEIASDRWVEIAPLPRPRGAAAAVVLEGRVHLIGGASSRRRAGERRLARGLRPQGRPLERAQGDARRARPRRLHRRRRPHPRDRRPLQHLRIQHRAASTPTCRRRTPGSCARRCRPSARAMAWWCIAAATGRWAARRQPRGGVPRQAKVFGQMESYDPASDSWQRHAPMTTPRHAVGAAAIGDWIYVAGGGAVLGGSVQSAVHEAFTLGPA